MYGVDGQGRLCDVELGMLLRQDVPLHQQRHDVTWRQKREVIFEQKIRQESLQ